MTTPCPSTDVIRDNRAIQTLFLGASVLSFNVNMGWGGQPSSLSVELVNDFLPGCSHEQDSGSPKRPPKLYKTTGYDPNHYYECVGNDCFIDELGNPYDPNRIPSPTKKDYPGKLYFKYVGGKLVSDYWYDADPGFFGDRTQINTNGVYTWNTWTSYDIIGTPVYFAYDNFYFGGIVQSWDKTMRDNTAIYTVNIESMDSLLDNCWLILRDYGGSIFGKFSGETHGAPSNFVTDGLLYKGLLSAGNIQNVFNVYGFLESFGTSSFGGARLSDAGIPYRSVIDALSVLTSAIPLSSSPLRRLNKEAFSPFGRIISKTVQEQGTLTKPMNLNFGCLQPIKDATPEGSPVERIMLTLDLSEIPNPGGLRLNADVVSILEFLRTLTAATGQDFFTTLIPGVIEGVPTNTIKVRVVDRTVQPSLNLIPKAINDLSRQGFSVKVNSIGQEYNGQSSNRLLYIGGKQERLYQAKNYRLSYKQASYVYNPSIDRLVSFYQPNAGKVRPFSYLSTRNFELCNIVNGPRNTRLLAQSEIVHRGLNQTAGWERPDNVWLDTEIGATSAENIRSGNYLTSIRLTGFQPESPSDVAGTNNRYLPIFMDTICPFFGYVEDNVDVSRIRGTNTFRKIRPVWLDSWTGQIVVILNVTELPQLSLGSPSSGRRKTLSTIFPRGVFTITETEIRAAMAGFDSYLTYCFAKASPNKPQLFLMLAAAYFINNPLFSTAGGWANPATDSAAARWIPPGNAFQHQINVANMAGDPGRARYSTVHNINWDYFIDDNFIRDLMLLCNFIADIGNRYYGQKYMVRFGDITAYRDSGARPLTHITSNTFGGDVTLQNVIRNVVPPKPQSDNTIAIFSGSGKIYFAEEVCDSAWEEPGNVIDDTMVVGGEQWSALINEQGKIPAILGYNASDQYDYEALRLCLIANSAAPSSASAQKAYFAANTIGVRDNGLTDANKLLYANWAAGVGNNSSFSKSQFSAADFIRVNLTKAGQTCALDNYICPSINPASLNTNDYVLTYTKSGRRDAFNNNISAGLPSLSFRPPILNPDLTLTPINNPYGMSKKLYVKANTEEIAFLDILNLRQPRAIVSSPGLKLAPTSLTFSVDPTRTVLCNAALEDLIVYLKFTRAGSQDYDSNYVNALLFQIRGYDVWSEIPLRADGNGLRGTPPLVSRPNGSYNMNVSNQHAMIVEKAAHPLFAGVPVRSNQFTYGPWTNYPAFFARDIFVPGLRAQADNLRSETELVNTKMNRINEALTRLRRDMSSQRLSNASLQSSILKSIFEELAQLNQQLKAIQDLTTKTQAGIGQYQGENPPALENMVAGVKVEINPELVPWNYGGMAYLDQAALFLMSSNADYQSVLESAQITINSTPVLGLGAEFIIPNPMNRPSADFYWSNEPYKNVTNTYDYTDVKVNTTNPLEGIPIVGNPVYLPSVQTSVIENQLTYKTITYEHQARTGSAPIITNISVKFDSSGFHTTYSFKTYARKIGLYSKETADRLKDQAIENITTTRALFGLRNDAENRRIQSQANSLLNNNTTNAGSWSSNQLSTKLFGNSPNEVLVGGAEGFLPSPRSLKTTADEYHKAIKIAGTSTQAVSRGNVSQWNLGSLDPGDLSNGSKYRHRAWVGLFEHWETKKELQEGYDQKAAMSLDGIFSPVSFYPTMGNSTYPLIGYPRLLCPGCQGVGSIDDFQGQTNNLSLKKYPCPLCSKGAPNYLYNPFASGVNALNLQPVVVPYQPFRNLHAQPTTSGERQKHSIRVVGRNYLPPFMTNNSMSIDIERNKEIRVSAPSNKIVEDGSGFSPDFFIADIAKAHYDGSIVLNNHRFFALRGPLMMHGWGYDVEGFPVPNSADEPAEYSNGLPKRFEKTAEGLNDYTKPGKFEAVGTPHGLGDIIGKGWVREGGKWIRKPNSSFYLNWAERPDLWPVGPIDLRWDKDRGVWVGGDKGCTGNDLPPYIMASGNDPTILLQFTDIPKTKCAYKMIYVTLEEDLIKEEYNDETFPVRGFLDDIEYSTAALPNGVRRLVFIKDRVGYTAPRGAKLLCRYDSQYGFYEPVSKPNYFVFGTVRSGNNATIDLSYIQGKHRGGRVPTMNIRFINRFGYEITANSRGMFYFENGRWILVSVRSFGSSGGSSGGGTTGGGGGGVLGGPAPGSNTGNVDDLPPNQLPNGVLV